MLRAVIYLPRPSPAPEQLAAENQWNPGLLLVDTALIVKGGLEAVDGESDDAGEYGGGAVDEGHDDGVSLTVVAGLVVAGEGNEAAEAKAQREEDLRGSADPGLGVRQLLQLQKPDERARPWSSTPVPSTAPSNLQGWGQGQGRGPLWTHWRSGVFLGMGTALTESNRLC